MSRCIFVSISESIRKIESISCICISSFDQGYHIWPLFAVEPLYRVVIKKGKNILSLLWNNNNSTSVFESSSSLRRAYRTKFELGCRHGGSHVSQATHCVVKSNHRGTKSNRVCCEGRIVRVRIKIVCCRRVEPSWKKNHSRIGGNKAHPRS